MKITKNQLKRIIKEEISKVLEESYSVGGSRYRGLDTSGDYDLSNWEAAQAEKEEREAREHARHPNFMDPKTWFTEIGQHIGIKTKREDNKELRGATPDQYRYWLARKKEERASRRKANPPAWDPRGWFK